MSRWGRNGLYLPREEHLSVWVQHFVEALVASRAPLQPEKGRDWVGLGIARLELERPSPEALVLPLWEAVKGLRLGPAPALPPPPSRRFHQSPLPPPPERESCTEHPQWDAHLSRWEAYRKEEASRANQAGEEALFALDAPTPYALGRQALLAGLPALSEALARLEGAAKAAEEERRGLLELLDRAAGVAEKRARLHRLRSRRSRLERKDLEEEARALERELEPVDQAIGEGDAAFFLRGDPEAREAEERLVELAQRFRENERRWKSELEDRPPPPAPSWKRWLWGILARLRLRRPGAEPAAEENRKTLCDRAWKLLHEAWNEEEKRTQRYLHYEALLHRFTLLTEYLKALSRERERALRAQGLAEAFAPAPKAPEENPLVVRIPKPILPGHPRLQEAARLLVKEGALEALWDGDPQGLEGRLREAAEELVGELGHVPLPEPQEELWSTLVAAAAPRVLARHWPEHRQYAYVLGPAPGTRWGRPTTGKTGFPGRASSCASCFPWPQNTSWRTP